MLRLSGEEDRLDNLAELKQAIFDYEAKAGEDVTLAAYLDHAALFTNMDGAERVAAVKLMTVHAAKGLEFPAVFVCGLSEGIFPSKKTDTREKLEEERRLAYVACTRACDRLFLSDAAGTNYDGSYRYPSRFLFNAGKENLDFVVPLDPELIEEAGRVISRTEPDCGFCRREEGLTAGTWVRHPIFGEGQLLLPEETGAVCLVQFTGMVTPRSVKREMLELADQMVLPGREF
ncbi:MAG: ATP-dependent helicase [Oscillospiraceae bacterium]|nr:ATP-dependent helicase [Oscillospiraceae bacterium]